MEVTKLSVFFSFFSANVVEFDGRQGTFFKINPRFDI